MTTTPVDRSSEEGPDPQNPADVIHRPEASENWREKARRIRGPLTLITLGSLAVALYFVVMAFISLMDGRYWLVAFYSVTALVLTTSGPLIVYKGLS